MVKYKHKETGLFLTKGKHVYSSVYFLTEKGTVWSKPVLHTLSLTKSPSVYGNNAGYFAPAEFEMVRYKLEEV